MSPEQSEGTTGRPIDLDVVETGMPLLTPAGEVVGRVEEVHRSGAYVVPEPGVLDGSGPRLGPSKDREPFVLDVSAVAAVAEDGIHLRYPGPPP